MVNIDELNEKFGIEGEVGFAELEGDLAFVTISNKFADADISLYGGQIISYRPHGTIDILWVSPESKFQEGSAIRGGIPVCFPWFGPHETDKKLPQHGFARLMNWDVTETKTLENGENLVKLRICSSEKTKELWPHDFCAEMIFTIGQTLTATLKVTNISEGPIKYTCALHSYYNLSSIENITVDGLQNTRYQNQLDSGDYIQEEATLKITQPETRHYYKTESTCVINDPVFNRKIQVAKSGSKNTTVWNPWEETCKQMGDVPDEGYHAFICVEAVNKIDDVIELAPGETHETSAIIGLGD